MPLVRMPTGELVNMPDDPTPQQLAELRLVTSPTATGRPVSDSTAGRFLQGLDAAMGQLQLGVKQRIGQATPQDVQQQRVEQAPLLNTTAGQVGNIIGKVATPTLVSIATGNPSTLIGNMVQQGLLGTASGAAEPTGPGETASTNALFGGVSGALGGALAHGVSRLVTPFPQTGADRLTLADEARQAGVPLSPAQVTNSAGLKRIEAAAGVDEAAQQAKQKAYNRIAAKIIGLPDNVDAITPDALAEAYKRNDLARGALVANTELDTARSKAFGTQLRGIIDDYDKLTPTAKKALPDVQNWIDEMLGWYQTGKVPGDIYQANREVVGRMARSAGPQQHFMSRIVDLMDSARPPGMRVTLPNGDDVSWGDVNAQYKNLVKLDKPNVLSAEGNVNPATLWNGTQGQRGTMELSKLAQIGKEFPDVKPSAMPYLMEPAKRIAIGSGMGGFSNYESGKRTPEDLARGAVVGGLAGYAAPRVMQSLITSNPGYAYLTRGLLGNTNVEPYITPLSPLIAEMLRRQQGMQQ